MGVKMQKIKKLFSVFYFWRWFRPQNYQQPCPLLKPKAENIITINH